MRIKILFFIDSFRIGGMHKQVLYLVRHIDYNIFEPIVCVQNISGGLREEYQKCGVKIVSLGWTRRLQFSVFYRFIKLLRLEKPEIIFITAAQNLLYYRLSRIFYYGNTIQIGSFRAMNFWLGHLGSFYKPLDYLMTICMLLTSKRIIVNSYAMFRHYIKIIPFISNNKISVIYNGSDFDFSVATPSDVLRESLNISKGYEIVVMIARYDPWKDFETLFQSAIILKKDKLKVKFLLIGDGELRSYLERRINELELIEFIYLLGERKDIYSFLNLADISLLSTFGEGFSNSILESMAFGKPVVATDVGGNSELLSGNSQYGILVPPNSPESIANAIKILIKNPEQKKEMGVSAKLKIKTLCNLETYISSYQKLFIDLLVK